MKGGGASHGGSARKGGFRVAMLAATLVLLVLMGVSVSSVREEHHDDEAIVSHHISGRRFLAATEGLERRRASQQAEVVTLPGIYDSASQLKVKVSNERMMGLGNDEIYDFKFFMKVKDMGFLHESRMRPGKIIQRHAHKGDILNFVLDGSLNINGKTYSKGDWYLVSKNTRYSGVVGDSGVHALMFCSFAEDTGDAAHVEAWVYNDDSAPPSPASP